MRVKFILPALTEAKCPYWRPIKYSLFPPLGLATLAAYLDPGDEAVLQDEHVETLETQTAYDLVVIQVYITNAFRAYALADHYRAQGAYVILGGLHVTSLPEEAAAHAEQLLSLGLFDRDQLTVPVGRLSTGQLQRLALDRLLGAPSDVLLLDEPTNHLSPALAEELEAALTGYNGTLVIVSHDRRLRRHWRGTHLALQATETSAATSGPAIGPW